jgi:hypothetical protein
MANYKVNSHVLRLNRHLPFTAAHDQIYEEYAKDSDTLDINTKALQYLVSAVNRGAKLIILTGDAGHGKTHLCRRLLEEYLGYESVDARKLLLSSCDGTVEITNTAQKTPRSPLRIHKDFSELDIGEAAKFLESTSLDNDYVTVICANEGRLRAVITSIESGPISSQITKVFKSSFKTGYCSVDEKLHIINLNYQSIAGTQEDAPKSILAIALKSWVGDSNRWNRSCEECLAKPRCPIYRNRYLLSEQNNDLGARRAARLETLFATVERLGCVITLREALMTIAYLVTGGLTCDDVKSRCIRSKQDGWQPEYIFYNLAFTNPDSLHYDSLVNGIPVMKDLMKLDPGKRAIREIDDKLINEAGVFDQGQLDLQFKVSLDSIVKIVDAANGVDEVNSNPSSRKDRALETDVINRIVSSLRRKSFFDDKISSDRLLSRLGFHYGDSFIDILGANFTGKKVIQYKGQLLLGLHMIQGVRLASKPNFLYLVDPAFGRATDEAAIISRQIPSDQIELLPMRSAWKTQAVTDRSTLVSSVNWIDRHIIVRFKNTKDDHDDLVLDLMAFECVFKAASGYVAEEFYAHDLKRIRNFLAKITDKNKRNDDQISLFMSGTIHSISLDENIIQVT